jgi:MinD-like ATPase involved in chromosome partitioning or flagellar assembly
LEIKLEGIVIIVGNYGSGKSEVSINLAAKKKHEGADVRIADLDLVNPYFRTREARRALTKLGIGVVLPPQRYLQADLPILDRAVAGMIRSSGQLSLIDAGGDDVGATVLASLADSFKDRSYSMLQVVNPLRPFTDSIAGCLKIRREIETASKMTINGLIANPNLIEETSPEDIINGYDFVEKLSRASSLPLRFLAITTDLLPKVNSKQFSCPILPIKRQLVPPWKKAEKF